MGILGKPIEAERMQEMIGACGVQLENSFFSKKMARSMGRS
jgi:hypothetical protein